jgi:rare lipoprotein A
MEKLTAAHRTLAFETWVAVENLDNGKTVTVRITDRGPFVDGRIIDLSKAAARDIDMIGPGVANVRLRIVTAPPDAAVALFAVQVGAFQDRDRAERVRSEFERSFGTARIVRRSGNPVLWRVLVGSEPTQDGAAALASRIRTPAQPALVVRLDEPPDVPATRD